MAPPKPGSVPVQSEGLPSTVRGLSVAARSGTVVPPPAATCGVSTGMFAAPAAAGVSASTANDAAKERRINR